MNYELPSADYLKQVRINWAGLLLYYCPLLTKKRMTILENMQRVFKDTLSDEEYQQLIKAFFSHIASTIKEFVLLFMGKTNKNCKIEVRGVTHIHQASDLGKGVILLTGHFGNWEKICLEDLPQIHGLPNLRFYVIKRKLPAHLQKYLDYLYKSANITRLAQHGAMQSASIALKNYGVLIFPFDQRASHKKSHGIDVEFFGEKANCYRSLALLAKRTGAVIIPGNHYSIDPHHAVLEYYPAIPWISGPDKEQEIYDNTLQYNKILEKLILQHPEQWWSWTYKRWKKKF